MLPKANRLRHERDFAKLSIKGRPLYGPFCILRGWKSGSTPSKVGLVASGKIFKLAVTRNRIRRRLREALRPLIPTIPNGYDMIIVARPELLKADFKELRASLEHLIEKIPTELNKPLKRRPKPPGSRKGKIGYAKQLGVPRPAGKPPQEKNDQK